MRVKRKIYVFVLALLALGLLNAVAFAAPVAQQPEHVDVLVCHNTGSSSNPYTDITVAVQSVDDANGLNGHGDHGDDIWESFVFDGVTYPGQGDASIFTEGTCDIAPPPPTDVCPNLDGVQEEVPEGMVIDEEGNCVEEPPPPTDVCPNIEGDQAEVPEGMVIDEEGNCVEAPPPPTDVCPNIEGDQAEVPDGMVLDEQGNCVEGTPPPPQPTPERDEDTGAGDTFAPWGALLLVLAGAGWKVLSRRSSAA